MCEYFWRQLLKWYYKNKRSFSWRETNNEFFILIAEILLQQTNAEKVEPIYNQIIKKYSKPSILAEANLHDLENIIQPLGLSYRAKRLIRIAEIITKNYNDSVPKNKSELIKLPGVGEYISDAVLCYGLQKKTIPIDTNVLRLFTRFFGLISNFSRPRNDKILIKEIKKNYYYNNIKDKNYAVLDFASKICISKKPKCRICILNNKCEYYK